MRIRVYATLRDLLQTSDVEMDVTEAIPMRNLLDRLATSYPVLRNKLWGTDGRLTGYVQILLNGRSIQYLQGLDTLVQPTDNLRLFPPVGGG